ncbi:unannotated protein [freshwater metagenome]|uniref:Unannotated protein n=1 Tax=freshwater metagenome TaxID=449393 RepID=A0A6J6ZRS3_9ZZZZ
MTGEAERDRRTVDRERDLAQQKLQAADVVLVAVGGHTANDPVRIVPEVGEVRQDEVDAVHVRVGEHEPEVDEEQLVVLLDDHAVAADLAETAQEGNAH